MIYIKMYCSTSVLPYRRVFGHENDHVTCTYSKLHNILQGYIFLRTAAVPRMEIIFITIGFFYNENVLKLFIYAIMRVTYFAIIYIIICVASMRIHYNPE